MPHGEPTGSSADGYDDRDARFAVEFCGPAPQRSTRAEGSAEPVEGERVERGPPGPPEAMREAAPMANETNDPAAMPAMPEPGSGEWDETREPDMSSKNLKTPDLTELKPRIMVFGVGGAGCNAVNNMIEAGLAGCDFVVANTDAQSLNLSKSEHVIQIGIAVTEGLGAGGQPDVGCAAAREAEDELSDYLSGYHMVFITAGMGGGTGTGAAPVVARLARDQGILTVGVVTRPFQFEGARRAKLADAGIEELAKNVDTLIVIPNQNLFRIANAQTTFADAFAMADQVLYSGVACITDLMVKEGLINLDFADVRSVMRNMGKAMMGTGEADGEGRALHAAEAAISNPLLDETSMKGARGLLVSVVGGKDMTLFEVDAATQRIRDEVDDDASIIFGATFDDGLDGVIRVSVVATGIDHDFVPETGSNDGRVVSFADRASRAPQVEAAAVQPDPATVKAVAAELEDLDLGAKDHGPNELEPIEEAEVFDEDEEEDQRLAMPLEVDEAADEVAQERSERRRVADARSPAAPPRRGRDVDYSANLQRPISMIRRIANGFARRDEDEEEFQEVAPRPSRRKEVSERRRAVAEERRIAAKDDDAFLDDFAEEPRAIRRPPPKAEPVQRRTRAVDVEPASRARPATPRIDDDNLEIPAFLRKQAN